VDITVKGSVGGKALNGIVASSGGGIILDLEKIGMMASGSADEVIGRSLDATKVPEEIQVTVGEPGGYAEFTTYMER
jgi:hypothetical protein